MCDKAMGAGGICAKSQDFINEAKACHGDYYDYSLVTEKDLSNGKITIVCPKHGPFQQWKHDHLKARPSGRGYTGCRTCGNDSRPRRAVCKFCGEWAKYSTNGVCKPCAEHRRQQRKQLRAEKFTCPQCGKKHGKHNIKFCSIACWKSSTGKTKVRAKCVVCDTEFVRYKRKGGSVVCCGQSCANKYNAILGEQRTAAWDSRINRGRKAREQWKRQDSLRRLKLSEAMAWCRAAAVSKFKSKDCAWAKKCTSGSAMLSYRKRSQVSALCNPASMVDTWEDRCLIESQKAIHAIKKSFKVIDPWMQKAVNWVGNIKHRRYRVNQTKTKSECIGIAFNDSGPGVQMCFKWNEDHARDGKD
jgi:hypothetical protein